MIEIAIFDKQTEEEIIEITENNGEWMYWEDMVETEEQKPLTLSNINDAYYLHLPAKDEIRTGYEENSEDATVRVYDTFLSYLNFRIDNIKEDVESGIYDILDNKTYTFNCTLFEYSGKFSEEKMDKDIVYCGGKDLVVMMRKI